MKNLLRGHIMGLLSAAALFGVTTIPNAALADDPVRVAFVSGPLADSFFPPLHQGAQDAAKLLGVDLNYIAIDEADISASSARTMQAAIAQHPDVIVVGDFITNVVDPLIKQAVAAGIPVYVNQSGQDSWQNVGALGFVGQQPADAGAVAADQFGKVGSKNVLCVINVPGNPYLQAICNGLSAKAKSLGVTSQNLELPTADSTDPNKVERDIGAYLTSHSDIDAVYTLNALVGTAAAKAVKTVQREGKVAVGTLAASSNVLDQIKNGQILFTLNEQPYLEGFYGVLMAYHHAKYGLSPVGIVATGPSVVDKDNVDKIRAVFDKYPNVIGAK